jgi:hypothetical protein
MAVVGIPDVVKPVRMVGESDCWVTTRCELPVRQSKRGPGTAKDVRLLDVLRKEVGNFPPCIRVHESIEGLGIGAVVVVLVKLDGDREIVQVRGTRSFAGMVRFLHSEEGKHQHRQDGEDRDDGQYLGERDSVL